MKTNEYCSNINIIIRTTACSLDPNAISSNPEQSLANYRKEFDTAILNEFPGANIVHEDSDDSRGIVVRGLYDNNHVEYVERAVQTMGEDIYAQGNFWAE